MPEPDYAKLDVLILDVDGVLTDGRVILTPSGEEIKEFCVRDGSGMKYWQRVGGKIGIISGRGSPAILRRAEELGVDAVRLNAKDKLPALREMLAQMNVTPDRVVAVGDDLPDVPVLREAALAAAPADAVEEVRSLAHYVTKASGGRGAVREVIELVLRRNGKWQQILGRYFPAPQETQA